MDTIILNGYPIGVVKTNFVLTEKEKKIILNSQHTLNLNDIRKEKLYTNLISQDSNILKKKELKRIEEIMFYWVNEYKNKILQINNELRLVQSWSTINNNSNHYIHGHRNSFISCSFYLENEGENKLFFRAGKSKLEESYYFDYDIIEYNLFNSENWTVDITQGMIIVFLSDLLHESVNKGRKILIGSNYFITGKIGSHQKYSYLEI